MKIETYHPKISDITIENYNIFKNRILIIKDEKKSYNIFDDIYEFGHINNIKINFNEL